MLCKKVYKKVVRQTGHTLRSTLDALCVTSISTSGSTHTPSNCSKQ